MKKIVSLMAGAAVLAMAAPAAAGSPILQGSVGTNSTITIPFVGNLTANFNTTATTPVTFAYNWNAGNISPLNQALFGSFPEQVALFTISSAGFQGNIGDEQSQVSNTFSLKGHVTPDCSYYVGDASKTINFGEIGINAMDNNPAAAFMLAGNVPSVSIDTNLAGCNTRNRVAIGKSNLRNASASWQGYDQQVFTDTLKIEAKANYKATNAGTVGDGVLADHISLGADDTWASHSAGAWKSPMKVTLNIQNPGKALVAGSYEGSVSIELLAY